MASMRRQLIAATWILLALAASARGGEFHDPSGFSFTYPNGWIAINRAKMGDPSQLLPSSMRNWVAKNNVNLSQVAVILLRNGNAEFLENLNVVVDEKQQIPVNDDLVKQMTEMLPKQYEPLGIKISKLNVRIAQVGGRDALIAEYHAKMPGVPFLLWQKQMTIPGGGKTYTVTCTTKADSYQRYEPVFDKMLRSFETPEPKEFALTGDMPFTLIGGIVGGIIGAFVWIVKQLLG